MEAYRIFSEGEIQCTELGYRIYIGFKCVGFSLLLFLFIYFLNS